MRSSIYVLLLLLLILLSTSCASILNGKYQTVSIEKGSSDTELYIDGEKVEGEGKTMDIPLVRDLEIRQVKAKREGYKDEYSIIAPRKSSGLKAIPFAIAAVAGGIQAAGSDLETGAFTGLAAAFLYGVPTLYFDKGRKSRNYESLIYVESPKKPLTYRAEDEKYLFSQEINFDLKPDSFKIFYVNENYYLARPNALPSAAVNDEDIRISNTIFTDAINGFLYKTSFMDTTRKILKQKSNTNYLNAQIQRIESYELVVPGLLGESYFFAHVNVNWEVTNIYGKTIFSKALLGKSGRFSGSIPDDFDAVRFAIKDAIEVSLLELFKEEEVKQALKRDQVQQENVDPITLNPTLRRPQSLEEAQLATVTIKVDEGHGSGFFITEDGFVLTNYHVVATTEDTLKVLTSDGKSHEGVLIRKDEENDIALIKVDVAPSVAFGFPAEKNYQLGDNIFAIGTPTSIELGQTLSRGIISGERKVGETSLIQTDASINFGNSGGPIVNEQGELIGIINSKLVGLGVEGIAFGSPAFMFKQYLNLNVE